jgi:hypothetical protein
VHAQALIAQHIGEGRVDEILTQEKKEEVERIAHCQSNTNKFKTAQHLPQQVIKAFVAERRASINVVATLWKQRMTTLNSKVNARNIIFL